MDVVRAVNDANLILPAGDVRLGPFDYNIYCNSQIEKVDDINRIPLKTVGNSSVLVADVGLAKDASQIQNNIVRVDGQKSVYLPVLRQGGDANTIAVVDGIKQAVSHLLDVPAKLVTRVVFDQSIFVRNAIENLIHEGALGLVLTGLMILVFLGSMRATFGVFLSIPLSALATFFALSLGGGTVNTMILGGLALAFSRLIDNSVVVLENIFRHIELGESPMVAAEKGGREVALPVLAATLTTVVVFFPVTFLYGVSRFLFSALALAVVLSLFASYLVAMTVVPLFCARFIKGHKTHATAAHSEGPSAPVAEEKNRFARFNVWFNRKFTGLLDRYDGWLQWSLLRPAATVAALIGVFLASLAFFPLLGVAYFPRTDPGQFVINLKAPTGTRLEKTEELVQRVEQIIRQEVATNELGVVVANIGVTPGFSSMYTPNSAQHTAFVQASLRENHKTGSYEYMNRIRKRLETEMPEISAYLQSGGLVDAVLNLGLPAPMDIQVSGSDIEAAHRTATELSQKIRALPGVSDVLVPQDIDYPALRLEIDRGRASELGLSSKEVVGNVITALTSDQMIAPSYWVDPKSGNDYLLTVQYFEGQVKSLSDLNSIPVRSANHPTPARLDAVSQVKHIRAPTEVDHYQLRRVMDVYVATKAEDLGRVLKEVNGIVSETSLPEGVRVTVRGSVQGMQSSFKSFGLGLILSIVLVYLILVAQFRSWIDPLIILLAVPTGLTGVIVTLLLTGTTLNVMSLMGIVMMVGIVVSNSILIVEFTHRLREHGTPLLAAVTQACRVRLRPVLMTSLATLIGLLPMAARLGTGSEAYAPLARAIIGGLAVSVVLTVFIVPAAYLLVYRRKQVPAGSSDSFPAAPAIQPV
jgi:multidrug efflux pump subunit AcrB